ncbi:hypothetical protein EV426DRAFT_563207 [Tirmania nivea]|nr:hypothetical protein EV426DRAFT_563207 [Tirmania nivea]
MADKDFADYEAPTPIIPTTLVAISSVNPPGATPVPGSFQTPAPIPFDSPWYAVWQRHSPSEFLLEFYVLILITFVVSFHTWGVRRNRRIAREWVSQNKDVLEREFAMVGFDAKGRPNTLTEGGQDKLLSEAGFGKKEVPVDLILRENSPTEFVVYATGRNNVAFMHMSISLMRRNNPIALVGEFLAGFIFDAIPEPRDSVTVTLAPFDGGEQALLQAGGKKGESSKFDNFIWALVNKKTMNKWRQERYDLSLTITRDWEGLPSWCSIMTEAKEIGDLVLTKEIKEAVEKVGEDGGLEYLLISDQRLEKPKKIEETVPKKRQILHLTLPSSNSLFSLIPFLPSPAPNAATPALLSAFIRFTDHLVSVAHFRPEVHRKLKATRDEQIKALQKVKDEEEKEERDQKKAEEKKRGRDARLRGMTSDEQRRFLEKEKEKEMRRAAKKGKGIKM